MSARPRCRVCGVNRHESEPHKDGGRRAQPLSPEERLLSAIFGKDSPTDEAAR